MGVTQPSQELTPYFLLCSHIQNQVHSVQRQPVKFFPPFIFAPERHRIRHRTVVIRITCRNFTFLVYFLSHRNNCFRHFNLIPHLANHHIAVIFQIMVQPAGQRDAVIPGNLNLTVPGIFNIIIVICPRFTYFKRKPVHIGFTNIPTDDSSYFVNRVLYGYRLVVRRFFPRFRRGKLCRVSFPCLFPFYAHFV